MSLIGGFAFLNNSGDAKREYGNAFGAQNVSVMSKPYRLSVSINYRAENGEAGNWGLLF